MTATARQALRVLLLEDSPSDAELVVLQLQRAGFEPMWQRVETKGAFLAALDPALDVILADFNLPSFNALHALELVRERRLDVPLIVVSGSIGEDVAVNALQEGRG
jgi:DNA-binding response OmpR family regulator